MNDEGNTIARMIGIQKYHDVMALVKELPEHIHYLENQSINIEGINIYGSPFSPTFGHNWAFNKDRGGVIAKEWAKIPKNTNILLTHTPPYGILDMIEDKFKRTEDEDIHVGCRELLDRIKFCLPELRINSFGHIHDNAGCIHQKVSSKRRVLFINACVLDNYYNVITRYPITIDYE